MLLSVSLSYNGVFCVSLPIFQSRSEGASPPLSRPAPGLLLFLVKFLCDFAVWTAEKMLRCWGEIPVSSSQANRSSFDLLQREFRTVEVQDPPLHQPSANKPRPTTMLDIPSEPCSLTIHTIQLIQHNRRLRSLITLAQTQAQQQAEGIKMEESETLPLCPSSPPLPDDLLPLDSKIPKMPFHLRHSDPESDFYRWVLKPFWVEPH